jgi:hypothetical protein
MKPMCQPGPEHKRLEYFAGHWTSEADMKPGPMGPGGKITIQEDAQWMEGSFFLVLHARFTSASMGDGSSIAFFGYNAYERLYTYDEFDSFGEAIHSKGTLDGDTWTWRGERAVGAQTMKTRLTMKIVSPAFYTYRFEVSPNGAQWDLVLEGKDTKNRGIQLPTNTSCR